MPAYNFQRQFTQALLRGLIQLNHEASPRRMDGALETIAQCWGVDENTRPKRQTIRAHRKRPTKPGETLYLYTGMRTKQCVKLGEAVCKTVEPICLFSCRTGYAIKREIRIGDHWCSAKDRFARADGFEDVKTMLAWFQKTHGLPFTGELITW